MLWVKSSQRRNSPRINRFQQGNRERERKGFGRRRMRFGEQNLTTLSLTVSPSLCIALLHISSHLFCFSLSLLRLILSLSIHLTLVQLLIYDCMQCASFSEIGWICMSYCAIIRAWPQLSVTWTSQTQHSAVFHLTCFHMIFRMGVQTAVIWVSLYLSWKSLIYAFLKYLPCSRCSVLCYWPWAGDWLSIVKILFQIFYSIKHMTKVKLTLSVSHQWYIVEV